MRQEEAPGIAEFREGMRSGRAGQHPYTRLLGLEVRDTRELIRQVREGLSYQELEHLQRSLDLSMNELAALVRITPRTLGRRKGAGRLQPDESDRLLRAARVFGKALELFEGDAEGARHWLGHPQRALGGEVPLEMVATEVGAREVEDLIGRLEHGVFS